MHPTLVAGMKGFTYMSHRAAGGVAGQDSILGTEDYYEAT